MACLLQSAPGPFCIPCGAALWTRARAAVVSMRRVARQARCHHGAATLCQTRLSSPVRPALSGRRVPPLRQRALADTRRQVCPAPTPAMPMGKLKALQRLPRQQPRLCLGCETRAPHAGIRWRARRLSTQGGRKRAAPGIEPGTSRTRSENHATRPSSQLRTDAYCEHTRSRAGRFGASVPMRRPRGCLGVFTQPRAPERVSLGGQCTACAFAPGGGQRFSTHPVPSACCKAGCCDLTSVGPGSGGE